MPPPWNNWYHVSGSTYGTWLRGSDLGFRSRHHRDHVTGDYKHPPPPGKYAALKRHSQGLMTRPPVYLSPPAARLACDHLVQSLQKDAIEILACAVDSHHFHTLARFPNHDPRHWIGLAKRRTALALTRASLTPAGGVWAVRCKCLPITSRPHQVATFRYILAHAQKGAATWRITPTA